jgi:hypothetical protein
MVRNSHLLMAAMLILAGPLACMGDSQGPGRVKVTWQVDGSTCKNAGLVDVRVDLRQQGETIFSELTKCSDGSVLFEDVPVGVYDVVAKGFDADANPIYEGAFADMAVKEGETPSQPDGPIKLRAKKGTVLLAWSFPKDKSNLCSFNNVDSIEVNLSQTGSVVDIFAGTFPCDPAYGDPNDLPAPLENGWVVISDVPPGEVDLLLFGLSPEGERVYFGQEEAVQVGNTGYVQVLVELLSCDGNCI